MKKLINDIFVVEVPKWSTQHELYDTIDYTVVKYPSPNGWGRIRILRAKYTIIGTITENEIDFDPRPFLVSSSQFSKRQLYRVMDNFGDFPYTQDPIVAFRSFFYFLEDHSSLDPDDWPDSVPIEEKFLILRMDPYV